MNCGPVADRDCGPGNSSAREISQRPFSHDVQRVRRTTQFSSLRVRVRRDDGVAVYLNGQELTQARTISAPGALFNELANGNAADDGANFLSFDIPGLNGLEQGTNTLAAEIHQATDSSSDISFDLELLGVIVPAGDGRAAVAWVSTRF